MNRPDAQNHSGIPGLIESFFVELFHIKKARKIGTMERLQGLRAPHQQKSHCEHNCDHSVWEVAHSTQERSRSRKVTDAAINRWFVCNSGTNHPSHPQIYDPYGSIISSVGDDESLSHFNSLWDLETKKNQKGNEINDFWRNFGTLTGTMTKPETEATKYNTCTYSIDPSEKIDSVDKLTVETVSTIDAAPPLSVIDAAPGSITDAAQGPIFDAAPGYITDAAQGPIFDAAPGSFVDAAPGSTVDAAPGYTVDAAPGSIIDAAPGSINAEPATSVEEEPKQPPESTAAPITYNGITDEETAAYLYHPELLPWPQWWHCWLLRLALDPLTPVSILDELSKSPSAEIRQQVAENPKTSIDTLRTLIADPNPEVKAAVECNPHIKAEMTKPLILEEGTTCDSI